MSGIFLLQENGLLLELAEQPYDSEELLQLLLAKYPNLLAGDQIDSGSPRRWLLIKREVNIPSSSEGAARWSLDHLFLDQDAIPTLVEVKRSTDSRIRREVVGQMLDYAANAVVYWPVEQLQESLRVRCEAEHLDTEVEIRKLVGANLSVEQFWQTAKTNLQAGRVRLVFVADEIPPELRRIVEFLNQQMDPAEVLALEIRQYVNDKVRSLIPRVFGQTEQARQKKNPSLMPTKSWDERSFFEELISRQGAKEADIAHRIVNWARQRESRIEYGSGRQFGSLYIRFDRSSGTYTPIIIWTSGTVEVQFQELQKTRNFGDIDVRRKLMSLLNVIPNVLIKEESLTRRPPIKLSALDEEAALNSLLSALEWFLQQLEAKAD